MVDDFVPEVDTVEESGGPIVLAGAVLAGLVFLVWFGYCAANICTPEAPGGGPALAGAASPVEVEDWESLYRARVVRVVDADTLDLSVSLGFEIEVLARVRLVGLDAPEMRTAEGKEAREAVVGLCPEDSSVVLETSGDKKDKFGRLLGRVRLAGGVVLNDYLLENGLAVPYRGW